MIRNRSFYLFICGLVAYLGALSFGAVAERRLPELSNGMSSVEVTRLWGPPVERVEQETKRGEIWYYGESSVQFVGGKVTVWKNATAPVIVAVPSSDKKGEDSGDLPVADLLDDIIEEPADTANGGAPIQAGRGEITPLPQ